MPCTPASAKALIVYTSITDNAHQTAQRLAETFRAYHVEPTLVRPEIILENHLLTGSGEPRTPGALYQSIC